MAARHRVLPHNRSMRVGLRGFANRKELSDAQSAADVRLWCASDSPGVTRSDADYWPEAKLYPPAPP